MVFKLASIESQVSIFSLIVTQRCVESLAKSASASLFLILFLTLLSTYSEHFMETCSQSQVKLPAEVEYVPHAQERCCSVDLYIQADASTLARRCHDQTDSRWRRVKRPLEVVERKKAKRKAEMMSVKIELEGGKKIEVSSCTLLEALTLELHTIRG